MTITTLSSREFSQNASRAKKAAYNGPVFITDRGRVAYVLLTIEEYHRLIDARMSLRQALEQTAGDFSLEPPRIERPLFRPADLD